MSLTRRLFAKKAPLAIGAGAMLTGGPAPAHPPTNVNWGAKVPEQLYAKEPSIADIIMNKKRNDYHKAMNDIRRLHNTLASRAGGVHRSWNTNIDALRSVATQHKVLMQEEMYKKLNEERLSWRDKLLKQFGLTPKDAWDEDGPADASPHGGL